MYYRADLLQEIRVSFPVSRDALYAEIWSEPMTTVAARYGVSSSFLARVCDGLTIPRPPRGYWAKRAVGKRVAQPALPSVRPGDPREWKRGDGLRGAPRALPVAPARRSARRASSGVTPSTPHSLVADVREHFVGSRPAESGHLRPSKRRLVDLYVSERTLDRALAFAAALFGELESRGYHVTLVPRDQHLGRPALDERPQQGKSRDRYEHRYGTWSPDRPTVVYVGTVAIGLSIYERSERVEVHYVDGKYTPVTDVPSVTRRGAAQAAGSTHQKDLASGRLGLRAASPYALAWWESY